MVSLESINTTSMTIEQNSSPRISFSAEFLDENSFISITPNGTHQETAQKEREKTWNAEFEFLSSNVSSHTMLSTADELFFEGKLLPFWKMQQADKLNKMTINVKNVNEGEEKEEMNKDTKRNVNWFVDDDPSPRPPNCTVLWKELLRLKKKPPSSLSPSSSSSSSSSSSLADVARELEGKEGISGKKEKDMKRIKKGLERTRSSSLRIRPMVNVPICTQVKTSPFPPLFPLKKGRVDR